MGWLGGRPAGARPAIVLAAHYPPAGSASAPEALSTAPQGREEGTLLGRRRPGPVLTRLVTSEASFLFSAIRELEPCEVGVTSGPHFLYLQFWL